jgi:RNA polymerase sigma factor (sigma-70 family)
MAADHLNRLVHRLHRSVATSQFDALPDVELLELVRTSADSAAFEALVRRNGSRVLAAARQVLTDAADVDDVFQATFLVLLKKAKSIRKRQSLGGWLYSVAHRLALRTRKQTGRRERLEAEIPAAVGSEAPDFSWREACAILHEELDRLPDAYRLPLLLCYIDGHTRDEVARQLGVKVDVLRGRLERGRDRLRSRLTRRGVALSAGLLSAVANPATAGGPSELLLRAVVGSATTGHVSAKISALVQGAVSSMTIGKFKLLAAAVLTAGVISTGAYVTKLGSSPSPTPPPQANEMPPASAAPPPPVAEANPLTPDEKAATRTLRVVVLDPQGKPLPSAKIHASIWTEEKGFKANHDYETEVAGAVQVELPKTFYILRLWASKKPFVTMFANWEQNELASAKKLPADYTFRLEACVTAGGRIVNEQGKPIAGAKIQVAISNDPKPPGGDGRARYNNWLAERDDAATTDADGHWHIDNVPDHPQVELNLLVSHPDYASDENWGRIQKAADVTTAMMRQGTANLTLKRGVIVHGQVTDPTGKPIKDAIVVHGNDPYFATMPSKFPTDADGNFRLPALAPGETTLTVIAPGWAPQLRKVQLEPGLPPQDFRMGPGKAIRLRIVDAAGKPFPKAYVNLIAWKGSKSIESSHNPNHPKAPDTKIPRRPNADGVWEWLSAPEDGEVKLNVSSIGGATVEFEIAGGAPVRTVVVKAEHRVTGRVTDVVTGKLIPTFTVIPIDVFRKDWLSAERGNAAACKDGRLGYLATRADIPLRLRVEADGYRTQDGPEFRVGDDAGRTQDFHLQPSEPIAGVVFDTNGKPAAKTEILVATPTEQVELESQFGNHKTNTDVAGRFAIPDPGEAFVVVAQSNAGFALADFPAERHDVGTLRLQPWASVRGQFRDGGQPVHGARLHLQLVRLESLDQPRIQTTEMQVVTGRDGRFEFPRVPPVPVVVWVSIGPWKDETFRSGPHVPLDLKPGQKVELDLGSAGAVVSGKVTLTGKIPKDLDCNYSLNFLVRREPGIAPPFAIAVMGFDIRNGWRNTWEKTAEGSAYAKTLQRWFVKLAPDGTFRISGVPPGEYDLAVAVYAKPNGCLVDPLARQVTRVTVTVADAARGELALPEIAAAVVPIPAVGDTPSLAFQRADGTQGTLADCRGKYTVVYFWASWCGPCKQQFPALRNLHERFAGRGFATLGLALDDDHAAWKTALERLDLPWPQGRLAANSTAGVSSVPAYWLLGPDGKIVAKVYDPDELATILADRLK